MLNACPDELLADFQQYYHLDLWAMGLDGDRTTQEVRRAAALAAQLPDDGRVMRRANPVGQHSTEAWLLRQIELDLRGLTSKDGEEPEPIWLEGEEEAHDRAVEHEEREAAMLAASFGLRL